MIRPHCFQLILWNISSPKPSTSPVKMPNQMAISASKLAVADITCSSDGKVGGSLVI